MTASAEEMKLVSASADLYSAKCKVSPYCVFYFLKHPPLYAKKIDRSSLIQSGSVITTDRNNLHY